MSLNPSSYRIDLRDKNFSLIKVLNKGVTKASWQYVNPGGCGQATLDLAMTEAELGDIGADYDLQIWVEDDTGAAKKFYQGYVETVKPVMKDSETVQIQTYGYSGQLERVRVNRTYTNTEISAIIKDILDQDVLPETAIIYDAADIEVTDFVVDTITFDTAADAALETLANLAGNMEWGVDRDRGFFFKKRIEEIRHRLRFKIDLDSRDINLRYRDIKNRLVIKGAKNESGVQFEDTVNNTESQALYKLRSETKTISSISTTAVSQRYGTMYLAENAKVQREIAIKAVKNNHFFEETIPLGRVSVIESTVSQAKFYGDAAAIYGTFKYGGAMSFQIKKIAYELANEKLDINVNAGTARPDIADNIKRLEYDIGQLSSIV